MKSVVKLHFFCLIKYMKGVNGMKNPLKVKRQQLKISKEEIAKRLNTKLQNIKEWECGRVNPKSIMLIDIADAYEMTNDELIEYLKYLKQKE